ncbi:MAG: RrF2 family transcriptional regulator [Acidimicrobiales bacterium]
MRLGEGVEWAIHCCSILAALPPGRVLPAKALAEFHDVPAPYLAKHLQALASAGLVEATPGRAGGYRLARSASGITLLEVVEAVEGRTPAFRCSEIRRQGPCASDDPGAYSLPCGINRRMLAAEAAWRAALAAESLADVVAELPRTVSPDAAAKALPWLAARVR